MNPLDPRSLQASAVFQSGEDTGRSVNRVPIIRASTRGSDGEQVDTAEFHIPLTFRNIGAATVPLTWAMAALEAHCAPLECIELAYAEDNTVAVTISIGKGWGVPPGMQDFLSLLQTNPHLAVFEWTLDMLPHYSHVAARAVADPERFEQIGAGVRADLLAGAKWIIPEVKVPCSHPRDCHWDDDSLEERARTAGVLQRLRAGLMRWRGGAL